MNSSTVDRDLNFLITPTALEAESATGNREHTSDNLGVLPHYAFTVCVYVVLA